MVWPLISSTFPHRSRATGVGAKTGAAQRRPRPQNLLFLIIRIIVLALFFAWDYLGPIPLLYGARCGRLRGVDSGLRWPPRCRTLGMPSGAFLLTEEEGTDAGNTGGRPKCMSGRQLARTGRLGGSDASWDMEQAAKSIRVRNAGVELRPRLPSSPCASRTRLPRGSPTWRRGRGETPCVPHAPLGT